MKGFQCWGQGDGVFEEGTFSREYLQQAEAEEVWAIPNCANDNTYVVDRPTEIGISSIFSVADLSTNHPSEVPLYPDDNSRASFVEVEEIDIERVVRLVVGANVEKGGTKVP